MDLPWLFIPPPMTERRRIGPIYFGREYWGYMTRRGIQVVDEEYLAFQRDKTMRWKLWGIDWKGTFIGVMRRVQ